MLLRVLLLAFGILMALASRWSRRFRALLTRDVVVEVRSDDGVARHFVFRNRRVSSRSGRADSPDCALCFATAHQGFRVLLSRSAAARLYEGQQDGTIRFEGQAPLLSWFGYLRDALLPLSPRIRLPETPPHAYTKPAAAPEVDRFITREPPVGELDPEWTAAHIQRAKLRYVRAYKGEPPPLNLGP